MLSGSKNEWTNFLEITRKILNAPYSDGGYYLDKPGCRKKHVHRLILLIIKCLKLKTIKNASLKKFDLSM